MQLNKSYKSKMFNSDGMGPLNYAVGEVSMGRSGVTV